MNLSLSLLQETEIHTITKVKKQPTISIPCSRIRITEKVVVDPEYPCNHTPICVVHDIRTDLYYILDGNHRFSQTVAWGRDTIDAWIIVEESKSRVYGKVSGIIFQYSDEEITFRVLLNSAKEAHNDTRHTQYPQAKTPQPFLSSYG